MRIEPSAEREYVERWFWRFESLVLAAGTSDAEVAACEEALAFVERHELFGLGIGTIDIHLIAAS